MMDASTMKSAKKKYDHMLRQAKKKGNTASMGPA